MTETITSGPYLLAALLALAAGAVSFASPCVVPLVPGYLAYLASLVGAETASAPGSTAPASVEGTGPVRTGVSTGTRSGAKTGVPAGVRARAVLATCLFVLGFTVVFLAQSVVVVGLSRAVLANSETLMRVGGAITVVMGVAMLGFIRPLQAERRLHLRPAGRYLGAPLLGAVFAFGWTVCLGPTLVGVLSLASASDWGGSAWRGLSLVVFYCAGLGLPFIAVAFGFSWAAGALAVLRRHSRTIQIVGAVALIVLGLLMLTGLWGSFIAWLQVRIAGVGTLL
ncbi:MAG TPA: cytochrome c biogenesis protein CcdA [Nakamurella multipartita]|jgi:cytochrome c-type biogenesis protein|nr:cytochrome c biogenesis protein CcdA [Nakamurella multipartita]